MDVAAAVGAAAAAAGNIIGSWRLQCGSGVLRALGFRVVGVRYGHWALGFGLQGLGSGLYLNPEEPTFLGFLIMISLYKSSKR